MGTQDVCRSFPCSLHSPCPAHLLFTSDAIMIKTRITSNIGVTMMRTGICLFLFLFLTGVPSAYCQQEYPIDCITAINMGDGRILHRELSSQKPLNGNRRIIDGYHSAYIQADFKDGLYNGKYAEYEYNKLKCEGSYHEGWKEGTFKWYDDEGRITEEKSYRAGKLDGAHRIYYPEGSIQMEKNYRAGKQDGKEVFYEWDGTLRREHNYRNGRQVGKQFSYLKGTYEIYETSYYNEEGKLDGDFVQLFTFGQPHVTGHYTNGQKDGTWTKIAESGDTLSISTYRTGREEGLQVRFDRATGNRLKEYHTKNDRLEGLYHTYDPETGELIYEATYHFGRLHGKERTLVRDNRYDYWEISTYVNGRQSGPFESRYVKNDRIREMGTYRNGHRTGRWKRYDINGKLEMEWEEAQ